MDVIIEAGVVDMDVGKSSGVDMPVLENEVVDDGAALGRSACEVANVGACAVE